MFKPGDLALIKQCRTYPPAVGRCVELLQPVEALRATVFQGRKFHNTSSRRGWLVLSQEGFPINTLAFGLIEGITRPVALLSEHLLMPLRGDFETLPSRAREVSNVGS